MNAWIDKLIDTGFVADAECWRLVSQPDRMAQIDRRVHMSVYTMERIFGDDRLLAGGRIRGNGFLCGDSGDGVGSGYFTGAMDGNGMHERVVGYGYGEHSGDGVGGSGV